MATDILSPTDVAPLDPQLAALLARLAERPDLMGSVEQLLRMDGPALARARRSIAKAKVAPPAAPEIDVDFLHLLRDLPPAVESARLRAASSWTGRSSRSPTTTGSGRSSRIT